MNSLADPGTGGCDDAECTLREAIADAAAGGRIEFAAGVTGQIDLAAELVIVRDLIIDGDNRITLSGQGAVRVLRMANPTARISVQLEGLSINDGSSPAMEDGGGILATNVARTIDDVGFANNVSDVDGGAIRLVDSDATIRYSRFLDNEASWFGGGIAVTDGDLLVMGSWFTGGEASDGGAIWVGDDGSPALVGSTLSGNSAQNGGAIVMFGSADVLSDLTIRNSTIVLNNGEGGGGLYNGGSMTVANSIVAANQGGYGLFNCSGPAVIQSGGYNVFGPSCSFSGTGDIALGFYVDPFTEVLEPELADNGGSTMTHARVARGRAVDAGYCPGVSEDQRGFTRPIDDPAMPNALDGCDIGAYELQGPVVPVSDLVPRRH